jgi:hypothetical protein
VIDEEETSQTRNQSGPKMFRNCYLLDVLYDRLSGPAELVDRLPRRLEGPGSHLVIEGPDEVIAAQAVQRRDARAIKDRTCTSQKDGGEEDDDGDDDDDDDDDDDPSRTVLVEPVECVERVGLVAMRPTMVWCMKATGAAPHRRTRR